MKNEINEFLDFIQGSRSPKTHRTYQNSLQTFLQIVGDQAPLTKDTYINFLRKTTDMNPSTQALARSAIKGLYYFTADTSGNIDTTFFHMADKRYALKPAKTLINIDEDGIRQTLEYVNTIRNTPEELRDRAFLLLLADSGLRVSEACGLYVGDIDLLEERAFITGKGGQEAIVKFSHRAADAIRDYMRTRTVSQSSPLFIRHDKRVGDKVKPITPSYIWHYVKQRIIEAGADKKIRIHDFRHFFVTTAYRGKGMKTAQIWARHKNIGTTNRYTHLVEDGGEEYDDVFNHPSNTPTK